MPKPDVRVRLSAEGVAEVVQALKKIQSESTKTAAKSKRGFGGLNSVLGSTKGLLGGLGIAVGFVTFKRMIGGAIEAADQINKLGAKVGATTEHLSALSLVARTSDADLNQVGSALIRMNKNIGDAAAGIPTAVGFLKDLGLELSDFKGKDSVETFELISKRLFDLEDQLTRNRVAIGLFGRSGAQLMPTMAALADEGLANVIARAEELGVLIDHDLAAASEQIKDDVEILKMQSEAMGINFMAGFGPELSQMLQTLSGDVGQTTTAFRDFGQGVGLALKFVVGAVATAFDFVGTNLGALVTTLISYSKRLGMALRGDFDGVKREAETFNRWWDRENQALSERIAGRWENMTQVAPAPEGTQVSGGTAGGGDEAAQMAELAGRRAMALQSSLDREIALVKTKAATKVKEEKRELEAGLQSLAEYYADRKTIATEAYEEELAKLQAKEDALADYTDPTAAEKERAKIATQRAQAEIKHGETMAALTQEEIDAVRDLGEEWIALEARVLELAGRRHEAARLGIEEEIRVADELARKRGLSEEERLAFIEKLRTALTAEIDFEEASQAAEDALTDLGNVRSEIEAQASAGLISQIEKETQLLAIEQGRLSTLYALAEAMLAAAEATGDPEKIQQAQDFAASIDAIAYGIESSTNIWTQFRTTAIDSTQSALADFFDTGMQGAEGLGDAFRNLAASVIQSLRRMAAEWLANQAIKWISGSFAGGGEVGGDFIGPPAAAAGGLLRGPGTGTSDSILARLSTGEFVTRAKVVAEPGVLDHLRDLNTRGARVLAAPSPVRSMSTPRYADGGLVAAAATTSTVEGRVELGLEEGLVAREISTPAGQRVLIETVSANRRAFRSALGI